MDDRVIETHLAVNAIVSQAASVLLTRRSSRVREPGKWCLPGGHVEYGETWTSALCREMREETGLTVLRSRLLGVYSDPALTVTLTPVRFDDDAAVFAHFAVAVFVVDRYEGDVVPNEEVDQWGWFEATQLPSPMIRSHPIRLQDYWSHGFGVVR